MPVFAATGLAHLDGFDWSSRGLSGDPVSFLIILEPSAPELADGIPAIFEMRHAGSAFCGDGRGAREAVYPHAVAVQRDARTITSPQNRK